MENNLVAQAKVVPHWVLGSDAFWYPREISPEKTDFVLVDIPNKTSVDGLDRANLAEHLQRLTKQTTSEQSILEEEKREEPIRKTTFKGRLLRKETASPLAGKQLFITFVNEGTTALIIEWIDHAGSPVPRGVIEIDKSKRVRTWAGHVWRVAQKDTGATRAIYAAPKEESDDVAVINDQGMANGGDSADFPRVSVRDFNVWVSQSDGATDDQPLTQDASSANPFDEYRTYKSPDGQFAAVWQYIPEQEHIVNLVESSPTDQLQPKLTSVQYLKPGDRVRIDRPRLFDLNRMREVPTQDELFQNPYDILNVGWSPDGSEYMFIFNERGHQTVRLIGMNRNGKVRALVEESSMTFIDYSNKLDWRILDETSELLWMSERDGWNHIYLYDLKSGLLKNQITKGGWVVHSIDKVDEKERRIWFRGFGMVDGQDPYFAQLVRINFDGTGLKVLTEGDGMHHWTWSPDGRYLIDTWSRVDCPPSTILRNGATGDEILTLHKSSLNDLLASGWNCPERFAAPGRDGTTMIYGIIIRPSNFDETQSYPVLEDIYASPSSFSTPKAFYNLDYYGTWAEKGYVVVVVDGMGTNWRSKAFHDVSFKRLHDAGIPDRIAWMKEAAKTRPWMDTSRVGIKGTSAGGHNAGAAVIFHGDFYKAASADSGCHDCRMDKLWWQEQWMGWPVDKSYEDSSNVVHADKLQGKLMLIVGDMDSNVDPSSTLQLVNALNKGEKDYELLFIPGGGHGCGYSEYGDRRKDEFFRRHLVNR